MSEIDITTPRGVKQYIVVNKGLHMSAGKMATQVAHASQAYFITLLQRGILEEQDDKIICRTTYDKDVFNGWICGAFTKCCLQVKNENQLKKVVQRLEENGFVNGKDFFNIEDVGTTEFNGVKTWTCIGLKPMNSNDERLKAALKGLQLYRED